MVLDAFHPAVARWFQAHLGTPTEPQARGWPEIRAGRHALVAAPTGSGKTLAAFLVAIDDLLREGLASGGLPDEGRVLYVSPLKALASDVHQNLQVPLEGIDAELRAEGIAPPGIRVGVRHGDTPQRERAAMAKRPPHVVVTTPESLYLMLTSDGGRGILRTVRTVIVDEIHAVAGTKRGAHLALSLARLDALTGTPARRIGLSATVAPIDEVARLLVGTRAVDDRGRPDCAIVETGRRRRFELSVEVPRSPLEGLMSNEVWEEIYDRIAKLVRGRRTTLVFVNTRRLAERVARHLGERLGPEAVAAHHGSLARPQRQDAEARLKAGRLKVLVATASLELGIDIGSVDLVCQIGAPRTISSLLQRVGRARHQVGGTPEGRIFPLSRDDLVVAAALVDAARRGEVDRLLPPPAPLDILAQQVVALVSGEEVETAALLALVRSAWPYHGLTGADLDAVLKMLAEGFATRRGRRGALLHLDQVHGRLRARRGARLAALSSGGAIPDTADYDVVLEPSGERIGSVNEDFAVESLAGDVFQLGNASWRILRIETGRVRVADAAGEPPNIPFWIGEAPARSAELSEAVSRVRAEVAARVTGGGVAGAAAWLTFELGLPEAAATQLAEYLAAGMAALGAMPTTGTLVLERFFDQVGDMHLVVHAPLGSRLNRALGLSLRKRFCQRFNFELQAAATDDAVLLSLGPTHSFPLADVFGYLNAGTVREVLVQALLDAPMFGVRWRWNATRALAVPRRLGGKRMAPQIQRMQAEDLLSVVFPDQLACLENVVGRREVPDHPLVDETLRDCLTEVMDVDGLEQLLRDVAAGKLELVARDLKAPSPFAAEILVARPYAYLDDAPAEERRTQAVTRRRFADPSDLAELGALDAGAIDRVRADAWPLVRDADELHDALMLLGFLTAGEGRAGGHEGRFAELVAEGRATVLEGPVPWWVAAERLAEARAVWPQAAVSPPLALPPALRGVADDRDAAVVELLRGRLESLGPVTAPALARSSGLPAADVAAALAMLEAEGFVLQGRFTPGEAETEWCERRLLARIHQETLGRLRREIAPVTTATYLRFLFAWQHVTPEARLEGPEGLAAALAQLEGVEAPAAAWEGSILPARLAHYDPTWLDGLCLSGQTVWTRLVPGTASGTVRTTPLALLPRGRLGLWRQAGGAEGLSAAATAVLAALTGGGALFFADLLPATGLLRAQVEDALGELVARGLVTADGFTGLRALIAPAHKKRSGRARRRAGAPTGLDLAGRWSRLPEITADDAPSWDEVEAVARVLLRRFGVVVRQALARETALPPWRMLVRVLRRLEARGELRGGRFVEGHGGEQFALPEAVALLRDLRRQEPGGALVTVGTADPLNLVGILTPGARVTAGPGRRVAFRDGVPVAMLDGREVRYLGAVPPAERDRVRGALRGVGLAAG